jgi:hypothetical protein
LLVGMQKQIKDMEFVVLQKGERLQVFDDIDQRITQIEQVRAENEAALWWEVEAFKKVNRDQHFDNEAKKLQIDKLEVSRTTIEQEMLRMKDSWDRSKEELAK